MCNEASRIVSLVTRVVPCAESVARSIHATRYLRVGVAGVVMLLMHMPRNQTYGTPRGSGTPRCATKHLGSYLLCHGWYHGRSLWRVASMRHGTSGLVSRG